MSPPADKGGTNLSTEVRKTHLSEQEKVSQVTQLYTANHWEDLELFPRNLLWQTMETRSLDDSLNP